ncbi:MAG: hypothetical protein ACON5D_18900 [Rubripirellula sp.]
MSLSRKKVIAPLDAKTQHTRRLEKQIQRFVASGSAVPSFDVVVTG